MIGDAIAVWELLQKERTNFRIKSALFDADGQMLSGDDALSIILRRTENERIWFYQVNGPEGYVYVYIPVIPTVNLDFGTPLHSQNADATYFRFVASPLAHFAGGGEPNVRVNFMVFAYQPSDLLGISESAQR